MILKIKEYFERSKFNFDFESNTGSIVFSIDKHSVSKHLEEVYKFGSEIFVELIVKEEGIFIMHAKEVELSFFLFELGLEKQEQNKTDVLRFLEADQIRKDKINSVSKELVKENIRIAKERANIEAKKFKFSEEKLNKVILFFKKKLEDPLLSVQEKKHYKNKVEDSEQEILSMMQKTFYYFLDPMFTDIYVHNYSSPLVDLKDFIKEFKPFTKVISKCNYKLKDKK